MDTAATPPLATDSPPDAARPVASDRTNIVTMLLGLWFTVGLLLDAWAHNNVPRLESFFTPWHAVFYSGLAATAGWIAWTVRDGLRDGRLDVRTVPVGYASSAVAVVGFALAGGGDLAWHTAFGIEQNINILFSPTHIGLAATMLVIVGTPVRAMWADRSLASAPGLRRLLPALVSACLCATLVLLFLQYANALALTAGDVTVGMSRFDEGFTARLVGSMALTNLLLMVTLLTLARRWRLPPGTATLLYLTTGALSAAVTGLRNMALVVAFVLSGVLVDVLTRYRAFAGLAALVTWSVYLATARLVAGAAGGGVVELYTGAPVVQAGLAVLLAVLLVPSRESAPPDQDQPRVELGEHG